MKFDLSVILINDLDGDGTKPHLDAQGNPMTLGRFLSDVIRTPQPGGLARKEAKRRKALAKAYRRNGVLAIETADREILYALAEAGGNPVMICILGEAFDPDDKPEEVTDVQA